MKYGSIMVQIYPSTCVLARICLPHTFCLDSVIIEPNVRLCRLYFRNFHPAQPPEIINATVCTLIFRIAEEKAISHVNRDANSGFTRDTTILILTLPPCRRSLRPRSRLRAYAVAFPGVPDDGSVRRSTRPRLPLRAVPGRYSHLLRAGDPRLQPGSRESTAAGADRLRFAERRLRDAELLVGP